jgi:F-type H+-transporting ATPase subunit epsilon
MAGTLQFDLVSPEAKLASMEAKQVQIPGMTGDFTAMPDHAPFLTTLRPGVVRVETGSETIEYVVTGGFADVSPTATTILAEQAVRRDEVSAEMLDTLLANAKSALDEAPQETQQAAGQRLRDVTTMKAGLGR